ncbi:hypothetical protein E4T56_gene9184 [Termitomyces sp. T112]|nr:hypothetical protein E4T56_gene9184 [Termitomyces sp. T112]
MYNPNPTSTVSPFRPINNETNTSNIHRSKSSTSYEQHSTPTTSSHEQHFIPTPTAASHEQHFTPTTTMHEVKLISTTTNDEFITSTTDKLELLTSTTDKLELLTSTIDNELLFTPTASDELPSPSNTSDDLSSSSSASNFTSTNHELLSTSSIDSSKLSRPISTKTASSILSGALSATLTSISSTTTAISGNPTQVKDIQSLGPIIGGAIGGILFVTLIIIMAVVIMKRCRRRRQVAPIPRVNPLLNNSYLTILASQRNLSSEKGPLAHPQDIIISGTDSQDQDQSTPVSTSPHSQTLRDVESAMQRQMSMMSMISERITALEENQRGITDAIENAPPDYESRASPAGRRATPSNPRTSLRTI